MNKRTREFDKHLMRGLQIILDGYISAFSLPIDKAFVRKAFKKLGVEVDASIDDRIVKIDAAKSALSEAMMAIDDIKATAQENKRDAEAALERLKELEQHKASAEAEYHEIKKLVSSDVDAFRKLGGIPDSNDIRKERYIGFLSGVVASIIASVVIWLAGLIFS